MNTPKTDAFYDALYDKRIPKDLVDSVSAEEKRFARQLETQVQELREALVLCYDHCRLYHPDAERNNVGETVRAILEKTS